MTNAERAKQYRESAHGKEVKRRNARAYRLRRKAREPHFERDRARRTRTDPVKLESLREYQRGYQREYYQGSEQKALLDELRSRGCSICGAEGRLHFHHRDPSQKKFNVSQWRGGMAELLAELEKCDLLCPTHRRRAHAAMRRR